MELNDGQKIQGIKFVGKKSIEIAKRHFSCPNPVLALENDADDGQMSHWEKAVYFEETM